MLLVFQVSILDASRQKVGEFFPHLQCIKGSVGEFVIKAQKDSTSLK